MRSFLEEVKFGMEGGYKGIPGGLPRFDKFTANIQKKSYTAIGALPKTAKTAFLDHRYVLQPYLSGNKNINWIYFSYEIDRIEKMAKYCAYFMYLKYGMRVDLNFILTKGDREKKLDAKTYKLVEEIYHSHLKELFGEYDVRGNCTLKGRIDFHEDKTNPTGVRNYLMKYAEANGKFVKEPYTTEEGAKERIIGYTEKNPDLFTIVILDHVGLLKKERGFNKKENIDKMSEYFVWLRNLCKFTIVVTSQFNRDINKVDRLKFAGEHLQPSREDFKDTGNLAEDVSMLIGLFNPTLYHHIDKHLDYDLTKIGSGYRSIHILDSRNTEGNVNLGLNLVGECGYFEELPTIEEIKDNPKLYDKYRVV